MPVPQLPMPRMTYREAMDRFGSDKPDLRFGMEIVDLATVFAGTQFKVFARALDGGGVVKAINAKGLFQAPIKMVEEDWTGLAKEGGLGGLAYIRVQEDGTWKSPIVKFFSDAEKAGLQAALDIQPGDLVLFGADKAEKVLPVLGRIRLLAGAQAKAIPQDQFKFTWVTDFPLFERNDEGHLVSVHHPFTAPKPEDIPLLDTAPEKVRAQAYDIVLNGTELGGGSIRIHDPAFQARMFQILGLPESEIQSRFSHLIRALGIRRAAARRPRHRRRPPRHAAGRTPQHPRRHRLPEDAEGHGPDDERAVHRGRQATARHPYPLGRRAQGRSARCTPRPRPEFRRMAFPCARKRNLALTAIRFAYEAGAWELADSVAGVRRRAAVRHRRSQRLRQEHPAETRGGAAGAGGGGGVAGRSTARRGCAASRSPAGSDFCRRNVPCCSTTPSSKSSRWAATRTAACWKCPAPGDREAVARALDDVGSGAVAASAAFASVRRRAPPRVDRLRAGAGAGHPAARRTDAIARPPPGRRRHGNPGPPRGGRLARRRRDARPQPRRRSSATG